MNAENHFKQLKHHHLHHLLRPRLDQLIWILCTKVTPGYIHRAAVLEDTYRLGRSSRLSPFQTKFKRAWRTLADTPTGTSRHAYIVNCLNMDLQLRLSEIQHIPSLQTPCPTDSIDRGGSITDGDDHLWTGDQTVLAGGGGWQKLTQQTVAVVLGKRLHEDSDADVELCAETHSEAGTDALSHASDHDEEELDTVISSLSTGVSLLREAADRLESQLVHRNRLWMKNIATSSWLKGVERFVKDTNHVEVTGRVRNTTWPRNAAETKRSRHVMGYHARYRSVAGSELHSGSEDEVESVVSQVSVQLD
ncbi:hypothetical protein BU15DRAFT_82198 [Melanogaster broomeanus]|nr:hypothetical protein BU15DRAFT_82198 [Melanogaster broomeanus]